MALPWEGWLELGWGGLLLVAAVLLLRGLSTVLALRPLLGPMRPKGKDALFLGWFGPMGAAALYYAAFSYRETGIELVWTVGRLVICASVLVPRITATLLTKLYGRLPQNLRGGQHPVGCTRSVASFRSPQQTRMTCASPGPRVPTT